MPERTFEDYDPSTRPLKELPLLIGITGPSFSGKSYSAGRVATGIQRVYGGEIYWVDTENDRALELHASRGGPFKFRHVPFPQPKSPLEYVQVLDMLLAKPDIGVAIIDTLTHEHIALLNMMEEYMERKGAGDDREKRDRLLFASMVVPKAQRKRLNERIAFGSIRRDGRKVPLLLLYRAQDKTKPGKSKRDGGDGKPIHKGWQAETSSELPYYMTARFLLPPGSDGHPNLNPDTEWERLAIKNPQQFRDWFKPGFQLSEEIGERLARWAKGNLAPQGDRPATGQPEAKKGILDEIGGLLTRHLGEDRAARGQALELAFGTPDRVAVSKQSAEELAAGLTVLRNNLEAGERMREPGEDDLWEGA